VNALVVAAGSPPRRHVKPLRLATIPSLRSMVSSACSWLKGRPRKRICDLLGHIAPRVTHATSAAATCEDERTRNQETAGAKRRHGWSVCSSPERGPPPLRFGADRGRSLLGSPRRPLAHRRTHATPPIGSGGWAALGSRPVVVPRARTEPHGDVASADAPFTNAGSETGTAAWPASP